MVQRTELHVAGTHDAVSIGSRVGDGDRPDVARIGGVDYLQRVGARG
ncbi:MAG: hypothetical protein Q7J82_03755 [Coriobacteriia bacterium]|nr:hypothetical protein [Coriobacteriia bacterium]